MADEVPQAAPQQEAEDDQPKGTHNGKPVMAVKVYAPFQMYFEGSAYSVSGENATGPFDILPHHKNFLCMLVPCELKVNSIDGEKIVKIHRALMHVKADQVVVYMDV